MCEKTSNSTLTNGIITNQLSYTYYYQPPCYEPVDPCENCVCGSTCTKKKKSNYKPFVPYEPYVPYQPFGTSPYIWCHY